MTLPARILAVDYGSKRIGLAISDPLGFTAQPLPFLPNGGRKKILAALKEIILEKSVQRILVGLPKSLDDTLGPAALECQNLAEAIRKECGVEVALYDERFTTREAESFLVNELDVSRKRRKELIDSLAACILLRAYMNENEKK